MRFALLSFLLKSPLSRILQAYSKVGPRCSPRKISFSPFNFVHVCPGLSERSIFTVLIPSACSATKKGTQDFFSQSKSTWVNNLPIEALLSQLADRKMREACIFMSTSEAATPRWPIEAFWGQKRVQFCERRPEHNRNTIPISNAPTCIITSLSETSYMTSSRLILLARTGSQTTWFVGVITQV